MTRDELSHYHLAGCWDDALAQQMYDGGIAPEDADQVFSRSCNYITGYDADRWGPKRGPSISELIADGSLSIEESVRYLSFLKWAKTMANASGRRSTHLSDMLRHCDVLYQDSVEHVGWDIASIFFVYRKNGELIFQWNSDAHSSYLSDFIWQPKNLSDVQPFIDFLNQDGHGSFHYIVEWLKTEFTTYEEFCFTI